MMLAIALVLYCAGSSLALKCKNTGCLQDSGFTLIYIRDGDYVNFTAYTKTDTWVGVAISNDKMMPNSDSVIGARSGNQYFLEDRFNEPGVRVIPSYDEDQNLSNERVEIINGYTVISYTRPINSTDTTKDINLDQARYVIWAFGGSVTSYSTPAAFGGHGLNKGAFDDQIYLCANDDESDDDIAAVLEQCPLSPADITDAAGHITVSLISLVVIVLMTVFTVSF